MEFFALLADASQAVDSATQVASGFGSAFFIALGYIIMIDIVLAGDNAIVIAMAVRNLPQHLQKKAIIWGTAGAIIVRTLMTLIAVWLLTLPGLRLAGGLLLVWIAYKLLVGGSDEEQHKAADSFKAALLTIVVADTVMGIDNVMGVAGAAQTAGEHSFILVVLGLIISIPIMVFCSTLILKLIERFPVIIYIGAAILVKVAVLMVLEDPLYVDAIHSVTSLWYVKWGIVVVALIAVLGLGYAKQKKSA